MGCRNRDNLYERKRDIAIELDKKLRKITKYEEFLSFYDEIIREELILVGNRNGKKAINFNPVPNIPDRVTYCYMLKEDKLSKYTSSDISYLKNVLDVSF